MAEPNGTKSPPRTVLKFHFDAKLHTLKSKVQAVYPFTSLSQNNRGLFKNATDEDHVVVTAETIFHPQGGGQPSDEGTITSESGSTFTVALARTDAENPNLVLHCGRFSGPPFAPGDSVTQSIDADKRLLYSRYHTAGHVLGSAVRHLLEDKIDGFDELKASHFPDSAACEFKGLIEGKWKGDIQTRLDEYVAKGMPVEVDWWDEEDFKREGLERLIPDRSLLGEGEEKFRVVKIVGAEVYPCGGTHVETTDLCGKTTVKKIARSKGVSRVSYSV